MFWFVVEVARLSFKRYTWFSLIILFSFFSDACICQIRWCMTVWSGELLKESFLLCFSHLPSVVDDSLEDVSETIAGRTEAKEHQTFFDPKTFGQGEAGKGQAQAQQRHAAVRMEFLETEHCCTVKSSHLQTRGWNVLLDCQLLTHLQVLPRDERQDRNWRNKQSFSGPSSVSWTVYWQTETK